MLGALHFVFDNKTATRNAVESFRKYYPNSPYFLINDNGVDHTDLSLEYCCYYERCKERLGYPNNFYGYGPSIYTYLERVYKVCLQTTSSHLILMEDDVYIINPVSNFEETEMFTTLQSDSFYNGSKGNIINSNILSKLPNFNFNSQNNWYAAGGGCVFRVNTFLKNYNFFIEFYNKNLSYFMQEQSIIGWPDFTLNLLYLFAGKTNSINDRIYEFKGSKSYDDPSLVDEFDILHHYKKYYK